MIENGLRTFRGGINGFLMGDSLIFVLCREIPSNGSDANDLKSDTHSKNKSNSIHGRTNTSSMSSLFYLHPLKTCSEWWSHYGQCLTQFPTDNSVNKLSNIFWNSVNTSSLKVFIFSERISSNNLTTKDIWFIFGREFGYWFANFGTRGTL